MMRAEDLQASPEEQRAKRLKMAETLERRFRLPHAIAIQAIDIGALAYDKALDSAFDQMELATDERVRAGALLFCLFLFGESASRADVGVRLLLRAILERDPELAADIMIDIVQGRGRARRAGET